MGGVEMLNRSADDSAHVRGHVAYRGPNQGVACFAAVDRQEGGGSLGAGEGTTGASGGQSEVPALQANAAMRGLAFIMG